jgi:hypothetical protein
MIEMEGDASKRFPTHAIAEIPFDVRQNRCTKEPRIITHPGRQNKKIVNAGRRPNNGNQTFLV